MSATSGNAAFSIANGTGTGANFLFNWSAIDDTTGGGRRVAKRHGSHVGDACRHGHGNGKYDAAICRPRHL